MKQKLDLLDFIVHTDFRIPIFVRWPGRCYCCVVAVAVAVLSPSPLFCRDLGPSSSLMMLGEMLLQTTTPHSWKLVLEVW